MIGDQGEGLAIEIVLKMLQSPHSSQALCFDCRVAAFIRLELSTSVSNRDVPPHLLQFGSALLPAHCLKRQEPSKQGALKGWL